MVSTTRGEHAVNKKRSKRANRLNPRYERNQVIDFNAVRKTQPKRVSLIPRNLKQEDFIEVLNDSQVKIIVATGPAGCGKAQPLDSKIKIPSGWISMGDIKIGDIVNTPNGLTSKVIGLYPQGKKEIFKITFEDGRSTECCKEHLWNVWFYEWGKYKTITTKDIIDLLQVKSKKDGLYIQLTKPEIIEDAVLPIDPYLLGLLLGDGFIKNDLRFTSKDVEIISSIQDRLEENFIIEHKTRYDYVIKGIKKSSHYRDILRKLGLHGCDSYSKFIPEEFKFASPNQKFDLIAGLMDTDGYVSKGGGVSFTTSSEQLATDITEIIRSLGGLVKIHQGMGAYRTKNGEKKYTSPFWTLQIRHSERERFFKLGRKKDRLSDHYQYKDLKCRIKSIEFTGVKEAQCIMLDSEDHLYITDNYIVTHNTWVATLAAIKALQEGQVDKIVISRPNRATDDKDIGFLPGDIFKKMLPWMMPIMDIFKEFWSKDEIEQMIEDETIEICPIAYIRGRTFKNAFVIVDEAQGTTKNSMLSILTRIGNHSKMVITGDIKQSDIGPHNGLSDFLTRYIESDSIKVIKFAKSDVERDPVVAEVLDIYGEE